MNKRFHGWHLLMAAATLAALVLGVLPAQAGRAKEKPLAEIYRTGKVRFIPELTIDDQSMGGKDFFAGFVTLVLDAARKRIYVCDTQANSVKVFDDQGHYLKTIGRQGQGPGDFNGPEEVLLSGDRLIVRELFSHRLSFLSPDGAFLKSAPIESASGAMWFRTAPLPDGRFIVQEVRTDFKNPSAPQVCSLRVYSSDLVPGKIMYQHKVRLTTYISKPVFTNVPIPYPADVFWGVTPDGKVAIGYSEKEEYDVYDVDKGKLNSVSHPFTPVEMTAEAKKLHFEQMTQMVSDENGNRKSTQGAPDYIIANTVFSKYFPAYDDLKVDPEGNVWVRLCQATAKDEGRSFDAFDRTGKFLAHVRVEGEAATPLPSAWTARGFWAESEGQTGTVKLVRYRISE